MNAVADPHPPSDHVLVVEDEADIRLSLTQLLALEGFEVHTALNGQDALHTLRDGPLPRLVLLDLMMPDMDGVELLCAMKRDGLLGRTRVILHSAYPGVHALADVFECETLVKPLDPQRLLALARAAA